jgi:hypothetical protein
VCACVRTGVYVYVFYCVFTHTPTKAGGNTKTQIIFYITSKVMLAELKNTAGINNLHFSSFHLFFFCCTFDADRS